MSRSTKEAAMQKAAKKVGELSPLELHALAHVAKGATKVRDMLDVGEAQEVDFMVHIHGAMNVGAGQTQNVNELPKPGTMLALVLAELKPVELGRVCKRMAQIFESFVASGEEPEVSEGAKGLAASLIEAHTHRTTRDVRGSVTAAVRHDRLPTRKATPKRAA